MIGFPEHLNTKEDYYNMLRDWPPLYGDNAERMLVALTNLDATGTIRVPVWPKGYDPDDPKKDPGVQPESWDEVEDPNGKLFRLGMSKGEIQTLISVVGEMDPLIKDSAKMRESLDKGQVDDVSSIDTTAAAAAGLPGAASVKTKIAKAAKSPEYAKRLAQDGYMATISESWIEYRSTVINGVENV
jgi:hypothetical protein